MKCQMLISVSTAIKSRLIPQSYSIDADYHDIVVSVVSIFLNVLLTLNVLHVDCEKEVYMALLYC